MLEGLFETLTNKFRLQFNETIKSFQFYKFSRQDGEGAEEWMGRLLLSAVELNFQEIDIQLKEQFIHGLNNKDMLGEIIRELTKVKIGSVITSEDVLAWAKRVEVQRAQAVVMNSLTEAKECDKIKIAKNTCKDNLRSSTQKRMPMQKMCRYCGRSHPPRQCLAYGKT